jgi:hypothetical protein
MATPITVLLVLRPAAGRLREKAPPRASNLAEFTPAAETLARVTAFFRGSGLQVEGAGPNALTVTGTAEQLAGHFAADELEALAGKGGELDLSRLPKGIREQLEAAAFPEPPEFGPAGGFA